MSNESSRLWFLMTLLHRQETNLETQLCGKSPLQQCPVRQMWRSRAATPQHNLEELKFAVAQGCPSSTGALFSFEHFLVLAIYLCEATKCRNEGAEASS